MVANGSGILCAYKDLDGMAQACISLIRDRRKLEDMKKAGREHVLQNFSKDSVVKEYLSICQKP